jgi:hypothetical protein
MAVLKEISLNNSKTIHGTVEVMMEIKNTVEQEIEIVSGSMQILSEASDGINRNVSQNAEIMNGKLDNNS